MDINVDVTECRENITDAGVKYAVSCNDIYDLSQDHILHSLAIMKSKLMLKCAPFHVKEMSCKMTPRTKRNLIMAYKRLNMYGKKAPFIACFDEFGRRLPDKIEIDTLQGITIKLIDPVDYQTDYMALEGYVSYETPHFTFYEEVKKIVEDVIPF